MRNEIPRFFQETAPTFAIIPMWQRKLGAVLERARSTTLQKISASDEGFLILGVYKPGDDRSSLLFSIRKGNAALTLTRTKPPSQAKPNSFVQLARKYLLGRRISSAWMSLHPVAVVLDFEDPHPEHEDYAELKEGPDTLVLDLDSKPPRLCLAKKWREAPQRYSNVSKPFRDSTSPFLESFCEWSLETTKTKHRATFEEPLLGLSLLKPESEPVVVPSQEIEPAELPVVPEDTEMSFAKALTFLPTHVRRAAKTRREFLDRRLQRQRADFPPDSEIERLERRSRGLQSSLYLWPKGAPTWYVPSDLIEAYGLPAFYRLKQGEKPGHILDAAFRELERTKRRQDELRNRLAQSEQALRDFEAVVIAAAQEMKEGLEELAALDQLPSGSIDRVLVLVTSKLRPESALRLCHMCDVPWTGVEKKKSDQAKQEAARLPYRTFRSFTGEFIRVSKSSQDADAMIKLMPANHHWLHILTGEGSHVWLERPKRGKASPRAVREAAVLAVHFSKQSRTQSGEVRLATRADIERKKNLPPGKVLVHRCETLMCRFSDEELQRILATQNERN